MQIIASLLILSLTLSFVSQPYSCTRFCRFSIISHEVVGLDHLVGYCLFRWTD